MMHVATADVNRSVCYILIRPKALTVSLPVCLPDEFAFTNQSQSQEDPLHTPDIIFYLSAAIAKRNDPTVHSSLFFSLCKTMTTTARRCTVYSSTCEWSNTLSLVSWLPGNWPSLSQCCSVFIIATSSFNPSWPALSWLPWQCRHFACSLFNW